MKNSTSLIGREKLNGHLLSHLVRYAMGKGRKHTFGKIREWEIDPSALRFLVLETMQILSSIGEFDFRLGRRDIHVWGLNPLTPKPFHKQNFATSS